MDREFLYMFLYMFGDFWELILYIFMLILDASLIFRMPGSNHKLTLKSSGACPESISDHPKLALGWLSQFAYFLRFHFPTFFRKIQPPIMTPEPRPQAKSYFI